MFRLWFGFALLVLLTACSSLPENSSAPSYALAKSPNPDLEEGIISANRQAGLEDDALSMLLLDDGIDAFVARLSLINNAQGSIDLQYYLYHSDLSGHILTFALWKAAERGVHIRLLLDDMDMAGKDEALAALSGHPNINIRLFNPFIRGKNRTGQLLTQFGSITRRMHNKSFTVDGYITILGGRNIGDAYFGADEKTMFGDLDVAITGHIVQQVSASFDEYWNSPLSYPIELLSDYQWDDQTLASIYQLIEEKRKNKSPHERDYIAELHASNLVDLVQNNQINVYTGVAKILVDSPDKITNARDQKQYHLAPQLAPYIAAVEDELIIVSPYFVPGKEGLQFFSELIDRGVKVKILTNSLTSNDVIAVHAGYSKYRKRLLEMGVKLYEMDSQLLTSKSVYTKSQNKKSSMWGKSKASLHAKYFVIDRKTTFIGSLNLDPRSLHENTEIGVIIEANKLSQDVAVQLDEAINRIAFELSLEDGDIVWTKHFSGKTTIYHNEPYSSWFDRFIVGFMRFLPGESQL